MPEPKQTYPTLPVSHWWTLRKKFRQSLPGVVTDGYLATVLNMEARSAQGNIVPTLKRLKIIDEEGKTGVRAKQWRDDGDYPRICKDMLAEVYPQELRDAVTDSKQRVEAERWFARETGLGGDAARKMGKMYMVLLEADASKQPEEAAGRAKKSTPTGTPKRIEAPDSKSSRLTARPAINSPNQGNIPTAPPQALGVNINLEIHISADSTTEQIDQIFASMAKHIYKAN